ncbi:MAG: Rieske 2Fe-2S domain-containing protein [Gemmataceae bacterium]|nr:Rieske 2Fe-2S domain-containing protein [Gemmataceae bacterium]
MAEACEKTAENPTRRRILEWTAIGLGIISTLVLAIPILSYLVGMLIRRQPDEWIDLGPVKKFPVGQTLLVEFLNPKAQPWDGLTQKASAYVRHVQAEKFQVFAINCAHLGCPVSWFPASGLFMCPCHGGVYYEDGSHASGPPPRGLFEYDYQITAQGTLQIKGGHLPTLQDPMRKPRPGEKA